MIKPFCQIAARIGKMRVTKEESLRNKVRRLRESSIQRVVPLSSAWTSLSSCSRGDAARWGDVETLVTG